MALFLSEAVNNYERKQANRGNSDLTEAALMLLNISEQSASLTEAVMTAEFTLMHQCRNLSEGETSNKMKDFGKKVWHNLKAFAKTVWAKIKEICRMVWRKLKEWGANVLDMFSGKEMEIRKEDQHYLEKLPRIMEMAIREIERGLPMSDDSGSDWSDRIVEIRDELKSLDTEAKKNKHDPAKEQNGKNYVRVGKNWLKSIQNTMTGYSNRLEKATDQLDKKLEQYEKVSDRMSHEDNQKDASKNASKVQEAIALLKATASELVNASNVLTKVGRSVGKGETSDHAKAAAQLWSKIAKIFTDKLMASGSPVETEATALDTAMQGKDPAAIETAAKAFNTKFAALNSTDMDALKLTSSEIKELERTTEKMAELEENIKARHTEYTEREANITSSGWSKNFSYGRK